MKVFVAGSYTAIDKCREVAEALKLEGHEITSSWLNEPFDHFETDWERVACATIDLHDVERADAMIVLTDTPSTSGGFHVEVGMALGMGIPVYVLGSRVNIYLMLPEVKDFNQFNPGKVLNRVPIWAGGNLEEDDYGPA